MPRTATSLFERVRGERHPLTITATIAAASCDGSATPIHLLHADDSATFTIEHLIEK
jgi:hypothetical protein